MTDPDQGGSRRPAIAGLAIAVVLLAVGLWLAHELTASSKMQDCLMSGRTNCNVIPAQYRSRRLSLLMDSLSSRRLGNRSTVADGCRPDHCNKDTSVR